MLFDDKSNPLIDISLRSGLMRLQKAINPSIWERSQRVHFRLIGCDKGLNAALYHMRHAFRRHMILLGRFSYSVKCFTVGIVHINKGKRHTISRAKVCGPMFRQYQIVVGANIYLLPFYFFALATL